MKGEPPIQKTLRALENEYGLTVHSLTFATQFSVPKDVSTRSKKIVPSPKDWLQSQYDFNSP